MNLPIKRYLALLVTYLKPQWGRTLLMGVLLLVNVGLQLLAPQMVRFFIDTVIARGPLDILALYAVLLVVITLVDEGVSVATTYLSESVAWTATNQMRTDLLAHCLSLDMGFHKAHTAGEMIGSKALFEFEPAWVVVVPGSGSEPRKETGRWRGGG